MVNEIRNLAGSAPLTASIESEELQSPQQGFILKVNSVPVTVVFFEGPLPHEAWAEAAKRAVFTWRDAEAKLTRNKAHVIVASLIESKTHAIALANATAVTLVTGALTALLPVIGTVYDDSLAAFEGNAVNAMARDFMQKRTIPEMLWATIQFVQGDAPETVGAVTTGLIHFIGREIEFEPAALQPGEVAQRVFGLCQYLMLNGPVINDGASVGNTPDEKIIARYKSEGRRRGIPVLHLNVGNPQQVESTSPIQTPSKPVFGKRTT